MILRSFFAVMLLTAGLAAQTIQPVIVEYKGSADGKFAVTNNTLTPMVVVLEPRSFDVNAEGRGIYRDLDSTIHVDLSAMSFTLAPQQTHYVFYKATAERLPAWFTVYATFSSPKHTDGLDLRLMLPHTVYLYGNRHVEQEQVQVSDMAYDAATKRLTGTLVNSSDSLMRVQSVKATGSKGSGDAGGFPLMPGGTRHIAVDWSEAQPPSGIEFHCAGFTIKRSVPGGA